MNMNQNKVFVTGGTGFIGSHLVDSLVESGYDVTALVRESSNLSFLPLDKINLHKGDIIDFESTKQGMSSCNAVFHIAAKASDWGEEEDFYRNNVEGTLNVLSAAKEHNIKKIIFVSTTGVLGEEDCIELKSESASYKPKMPYFLSRFFESGMNHYRFTKMLAEKKAIKFAKENNIDLIVIRPAWTYGPREFHAGPFEFCKTILNGWPIIPMGKSNKFHVVYVKDAVKAMKLALEKQLTGVHTFNIGNDNAPNMREYFNLYCRSLNRKSPLYVPFWVLCPVGIFLEAIAKLFRAKQPFLLTRARARMFYCNNIYDVSLAKKILGFTAETTLEEGVKETVEWWDKNGYFKEKPNVEKVRQKYIVGVVRFFLDLRMALTIFLRYFILFLRGKISLKQYCIFVKRIILFSKILSYNKAVRIGNAYKTHLYLPAFPTKAFYKAIDKFLILNGETIPATVVFSMTKACGFNCAHCYQKRDGGQDLPLDKLVKLAKDIQSVGVSLFDIEGGEPLLRFDRLLKLIKSIDERSEIWINTTGHTLSDERALLLRQAGLYGAMVSIHHWDPEKHDKFVGKVDAFDIACNAIKIFQKVGINTVINCCPSYELIKDSGIEKIMELGKRLNCSFVQIIHEKPAGGWIARGNTLMDKDLLNSLCQKHIEFNKKKKFKEYPSLSMQVFEASPMAFGCTAGGIERFYVNAYGEIQPCEFLNVSFGNIQEEQFTDIYKRMRNKFKKPGLNWLCNTEWASIANYVKEGNISSSPIKKECALKLIEKWDKGEDVPLYKRMKLCEKV
jgi:nucleoside-diphosphate-sugar epimerase/MoaA/NifB/PqqE/SkfB family radical SAM enzyme